MLDNITRKNYNHINIIFAELAIKSKKFIRVIFDYSFFL